MKKYDLTSIGEVLVEFSDVSHLENRTYFEKKYSGDILNTIFYASRLGLKCGLITCFGADLHTKGLLDFLKDESVDCRLTKTLQHNNNGIYFIEQVKNNLKKQGRGSEKKFYYWRTNSAATQTLLQIDKAKILSYIRASRVFYFTGISIAILHNREILLDILRKLFSNNCETKIIFDTNYREKLWSSKNEYLQVLKLFTPYIHVFIPSAEDLKNIFDEANFDNKNLFKIKDELDLNKNCLFVLKNSELGCAYLTDYKVINLSAIETKVIETTGAGDSFNAGFITGLIRGYSTEAALCLAQMTSVHALSVVGGINKNFLPQESKL